MKTYEEVEIELHAFLSSALDRGEYLDLRERSKRRMGKTA
jgi:hypothetical protein